MIQETIKQRLEAVQAAGKRLEQQIRPGIDRTLDRASGEFRKVLKELGADVSEPRTLSEVVAQIRERNPTLRELALRLDAATYDFRKKLRWDASMIGAYVSEQAGKTYQDEVKPRFVQVRDRAESEARRLMEQLRELTPRREAGDNDKAS